MNTKLPLALSLLAVAACQQPAGSVGDENSNRAREVAADAADPDAFQPGKWETKQEIESANASGLDAEGRKQLLATASSLDQCLPIAEVRRPDANFFAGGDGSECQYTRFAMQDGKLRATMSCSATPGSITLTIDGTYTPTSYALDASASGSGSTTTARMSGTWIGACPDEASQRAEGDPAG